MKQFDGLQSLQQPLSGLPQWVSERILQQINQLTHYEPVIGIMGKPEQARAACVMPCLLGIYHRSVMWRHVLENHCSFACSSANAL